MTNYKRIDLDCVNSTNDYLKEKYTNLENKTFVFANYQSSGRGQFERSWQANKGENILFSLLLKDIAYSFMQNIKTSISKSIIKFLNNYKIKANFVYPNDIYVNNKKICGILIETKSSNNIYEYIIVGVGLNVNQTIFDELIATSMKLETKHTYNINMIKEELMILLVDEISYNK